MRYNRGDVVYIRDFPFGKPTKIKGEVLAYLKNNFYNIRINNGLEEGKIKKYSEFQLTSLDYSDYMEDLKNNGV